MKVDGIVIGAGHAGSEAALAMARNGFSVLLGVVNKEYVASMPCNPSIGGPAKGVVVREIDALGGQMGINADKTALQIKLLNSSKGPGVQCFREQSDKIEYRHLMRKTLLETPNITIKEGICEEIIIEDDLIKGVRFSDNEYVECKVLILTTGTYLSSRILIGDTETLMGPEGQKTTFKLGESIRKLGLKTFRLKTGTPPRIKTNSIDFRNMEPQPGNIENEGFHFETDKTLSIKEQELCYLTYTTSETHKIINDNLTRSSMYSGLVKGVGPRYCPSIEDKLVRFNDKPRHQLFMEPESKHLDTTYVQGFSTSMPYEVQDKMIHSLPGLEKAVVDKWAYAIEYDAVDPRQLKLSLETKKIKGLFLAGQINGTSGYEEAAGQGLIAGINASNYLKHQDPLILRRDEAYIGVMIDDLVTKGTNEPYRLFTSRSEYRLLLRHDNADRRLMKYGVDNNLVSKKRYQLFLNKWEDIDNKIEELKTKRIYPSDKLNDYLISLGYDKINGFETYENLLKRPNIKLSKLYEIESIDYDPLVTKEVDIEIKYSGYILKEQREANHLKKLEKMKIPNDLDYLKVDQLSLEARQKLNEIKPTSIAQASRISGISPADIQVLSMKIKSYKEE